MLISSSSLSSLTLPLIFRVPFTLFASVGTWLPSGFVVGIVGSGVPALTASYAAMPVSGVLRTIDGASTSLSRTKTLSFVVFCALFEMERLASPGVPNEAAGMTALHPVTA